LLLAPANEKVSAKKTDEIYKSYRQEMEEINKTVHPFNEKNIWVEAEEIQESLSLCFRIIKTYGQELKIEVNQKKAFFDKSCSNI
jgi:uncharacterized protein YifN (PemK superfamily)